MLVGQFVRRHCEPQVGDAVEEGGEHELQFQSGEVLSDALVYAVAEGDVVPVAAVDVEPLGFGLMSSVIKMARPLPVISAELNVLLTDRQLELFLGSLHATELDATEPLRPQPLDRDALDRYLKANE